mmetsp:Transcript_13432/g.38729  ORF Transcript_13432/g.38729 Transcript_13432/m.38729 type:complete len:292 (+) Transcript_13432:429-1304(+)
MRVGQQKCFHRMKTWRLQIIHDLLEILSKIILRIIGAPNKQILSVASLRKPIIFGIEFYEVRAIAGFFLQDQGVSFQIDLVLLCKLTKRESLSCVAFGGLYTRDISRVVSSTNNALNKVSSFHTHLRRHLYSFVLKVVVDSKHKILIGIVSPGFLFVDSDRLIFVSSAQIYSTLNVFLHLIPWCSIHVLENGKWRLVKIQKLDCRQKCLSRLSFILDILSQCRLQHGKVLATCPSDEQVSLWDHLLSPVDIHNLDRIPIFICIRKLGNVGKEQDTRKVAADVTLLEGLDFA